MSFHDHAKVGILTLASVAIGVIGWNGNPLLIPLAALFPALWAKAASRLGAALVSAAYFLSASRALPEALSSFYGTGLSAGVMLWIAAASGFVAIHTVLWTSEMGYRWARYMLAALLMSVPPLGIVGWAHPITAAGVIFPGWGWPGLAAMAVSLGVMTTIRWPIAVLVLGALYLWSVATWTAPPAPDRWIGVQTQFGGGEGDEFGYARQVELLRLVRAADFDRREVIVLPENAFGPWTLTTERFWIAALQGTDVMVVGGATIWDRDSYDNALVAVTSSKAEIVYRARMPVPISMWRPWRSIAGQKEGANAHLLAKPVASAGSLRVAPLICYEQLLVWPILQSMLWSPHGILAVGNGWWASGTHVVSVQKAIALSWSRLFGQPLVLAFNT